MFRTSADSSLRVGNDYLVAFVINYTLLPGTYPGSKHILFLKEVTEKCGFIIYRVPPLLAARNTVLLAKRVEETLNYNIL